MSRRPLLAALVLCLLGPLPATHATNSYFWLSASNNPATSGLPTAGPSVPIIANADDGTGSIYIWGKAAPSKTLRNFSLNLKADTTNSILFTGSQIYNDPPNLSQDHWDEVVEPVGTSNSILNILGYSLGSGYLGIGVGATGSSFYDSGIQSWLIARVDYSIPTVPLNFAAAKLYLEIGSYGMSYNNESTSTVNIIFGSANDTVFNAGPLSGGRNNHAGSAWDATIPYLNSDFTETGAVGATDLPLWQTGYGTSGLALHSQGDANGDRVVNGRDFLIWQRQYGMSVTSGLTAIESIPEPHSLGFLGMAASGMLAVSCRRLVIHHNGRNASSSSPIQFGVANVNQRGAQ